MKNNKTKSFLSVIFSWLFIITVACVIGMQMCDANCANLKFAQISDAHYSTFEQDTSFKLLSSSADILDDAISQVNSTPNIDFTMFTGDMINKPKETELISFISHAKLLNTPWYVVFGNHDTAFGVSLTKSLYFDILNGRNPNFCYKTPYYSFTPKKGYKVIALDTIIDYKRTSQGEVSEKELEWLKDELDNSKNNIIIIFSHVPVVEPYPSESHKLINSYEVRLLLKKYDNPIIVCSGHYHGTKIIQDNNILYINTPSLVSYPNAFRIINVCPQRTKVLVDIYYKETRLKELQTKAKNKGIGTALLYGNEEDRTNTFELPKKRDRNSI